MAPFATVILAVPALLLEGAGVLSWFHTHESIYSSLIIIISSGLLAFCLNFSIFYVIHSTTAVTFNVAGNLKVNETPLRLGYCLLLLHLTPFWMLVNRLLLPSWFHGWFFGTRSLLWMLLDVQWPSWAVLSMGMRGISFPSNQERPEHLEPHGALKAAWSCSPL